MNLVSLFGRSVSPEPQPFLAGCSATHVKSGMDASYFSKNRLALSLPAFVFTTVVANMPSKFKYTMNCSSARGAKPYSFSYCSTKVLIHSKSFGLQRCTFISASLAQDAMSVK